MCADEKRTFTLKMTVGMTMALIGFCIYSHTKIKQPPAGLRVKALADPMHNHETESLLQERHNWKEVPQVQRQFRSRASEILL